VAVRVRPRGRSAAGCLTPSDGQRRRLRRRLHAQHPAGTPAGTAARAGWNRWSRQPRRSGPPQRPGDGRHGCGGGGRHQRPRL